MNGKVEWNRRKNRVQKLNLDGKLTFFLTRKKIKYTKAVLKWSTKKKTRHNCEQTSTRCEQTVTAGIKTGCFYMSVRTAMDGLGGNRSLATGTTQNKLVCQLNWTAVVLWSFKITAHWAGSNRLYLVKGIRLQSLFAQICILLLFSINKKWPYSEKDCEQITWMLIWAGYDRR